ncbi:S9 family peptidase [Paraferrimonas sedimenticola]|uniref:Periplasmic peptidase family S9 n=1 Tax=Paraferrimonas sedimenticola TaxID=375674 RepID=A0AA37RUU0_9GAMM|nr:prolyl oligopeptidase family serine peptidase [Paraferrimonas sedimenticola]GLP95234.1 periplasmic peptidase family S9 [Paraferrimonas sedimenticola]
MKARVLAGWLLAGVSMACSASVLAKSQLTLEDVMAFETIKDMQLSDNGKIIAYSAQPDRGDARGIVAANGAEVQVERGVKPQISATNQFVLFESKPSLLEHEKASKKERKSLHSDFILVDTLTGEQTTFENVKSGEFSESGNALALKLAPVESDSKDDKDEDKREKADIGQGLTLVHLNTNKKLSLSDVTHYQLAKKGDWAIAAVNTPENHQVVLVELSNMSMRVVAESKDQQIAQVAISDSGAWLAYTQGDAEQPRALRTHELTVRRADESKTKTFKGMTSWRYSVNSGLTFSDDEQQLFVGRTKVFEQAPKREKVETAENLTSRDTLLGQRDLIIWHGDDPRIKPNEAKQYDKVQKQTYTAVLHLEPMNLVQLADEQLPVVNTKQQGEWLLASTDVPYLKMLTWAGRYKDFYLVNINTGERRLIVAQQSVYAPPVMAPTGDKLLYYRQGNLHLLDLNSGRKRNLTGDLDVSFADEDHDYPTPTPGYGLGPWKADGTGLIGYDKYDVWEFDLNGQSATKLTSGRDAQQQYRVVGLVEPKAGPQTYADSQALTLHRFDYNTKLDQLQRFDAQAQAWVSARDGEYKIANVMRAKKADVLLFSEENYQTFPDFHLGEQSNLATAKAVTQLGTQTDKFAWGKPQLIRWMNSDGREIDGALFLPPGYNAGDKVPVLVYYYRFMSQRLTEFPKMHVNHRPNFAWYNANGYAVFLPDIRFAIGYPGQTAVDALVGGTQKLIDMGIADPDKIGLHGHSWSGYQTAFAVTQTNIFKAAVSGAPVSNMTSAYSGIRLGTGLARQFQYEAGQSRIGATLYKQPFVYWENSPIAHVERIQTPMMIMFGDIDDAVPWEQGIELYLAMRRTGKDVIMLQYQDEPHHLKKYPNKLDYTIRMKQYFDHYLLGEKAPEWISSGEAFYQYRKD